MYKNLVITGGTTQENPPKGPAGDVRAWDMHTGKLAWTFHSIPRAGEKYNDTWAGDSWKNRSGVNVWGFITVDAQRGIVYMPFGAPSVDQYGGDRAGDNLFSTSLVAADANTGKYLWHFQVVHHDIWDADMTGAPALIDVKQGGKTIPAVAAINKVGTAVSARPRHRQADLRRRGASGAGRAKCRWSRRRRRSRSRSSRRRSSRMTMQRRGHRDGHARTGSGLQGTDRRRADGRAVPAGRLQPAARAVPRQPWRRELVRDVVQSATGLPVRQHQRAGAALGREGSRSEDRAGRRATGRATAWIPDGPYEGVPGGGRFSVPGSDSQQLPCQQPPWGQLTAVNVNTGEFAWRVPLGVTDSLPPDKQKTGRPGNGGTIATAGGLVFVGATDDGRFRAFDAKNGKELWTFKLGGAAEATPMTYQGQDGKQYVVITSTGGGFFGNPDDRRQHHGFRAGRVEIDRLLARRLAWRQEGPLGELFAAFGDLEGPVGRDRRPGLLFAGRPAHFDAVDLLRLADAEVKRERALRVVAAAAHDLGDLLAAARFDGAARADGAAVRPRAGQRDGDRVLPRARRSSAAWAGHSC